MTNNSDDLILRAFEQMASRDLGGEPHMLALITPEEGMKLRSTGGGVSDDGGQWTHEGIPAFIGDNPGGNDSSGGDSSVGGNGGGRGGGVGGQGDRGGGKKGGQGDNAGKNTGGGGGSRGGRGDNAGRAGPQGKKGDAGGKNEPGGSVSGRTTTPTYAEMTPKQRAAVHAHTPAVNSEMFGLAVNMSRAMTQNNPVAAGMTALAASAVPGFGPFAAAANLANAFSGRATPGSVVGMAAEALGFDTTSGVGETVSMAGREPGGEAGMGGGVGGGGRGEADEVQRAVAETTPAETETPFDEGDPAETEPETEPFEFFSLPDIPEFVPLNASWLRHDQFIQENPIFEALMEQRGVGRRDRQRQGARSNEE